MKTYEATEQAYKNGYAKGYEDGIAEMETDNNRLRSMWAKAVSKASKADAQIPRWIPVTERLPDKDGTYIVHFATKSVGDAEYESIYGSFGYWRDISWDDDADWFPYVDVTHWMPLPEPPKGE